MPSSKQIPCHTALRAPKAGLCTFLTNLVPPQIDGRDGAVLLEGLSQCLNCGTSRTTIRGHEHEALPAPQAGLSTPVTNFVLSQVDDHDGAVLLEGLPQCLDCGTRSTAQRGNQHEALLTPTAGLCTFVTNLVPPQIDGRDGAVLREGLSQCLDCGNGRTAVKGHQHVNLLAPKAGLNTLNTDVCFVSGR